MSFTSLPKITAQLLAASGLVAPEPYRILITGQTGTDGTATTLTAYQDVDIMTGSQVTGLFGTKSDLMNRIARVRAITNGLVSIWVIPVAAAAGQAATADLVFAGTSATAAGTITIQCIDKSFTTTVSVAYGDTPATIATNCSNALAVFTSMPATPSVVTSTTCRLTANDVGTIPNKYMVKISGVPAGITVNSTTQTATLQFASGATDPTLTTIFNTVSATRFHAVLFPWTSSSAIVDGFLAPRNVMNNAFLQGVGFIGVDDTEANLKTLVDGGTPLNSQNLIFMGNNMISSKSTIVTPPDWRCAEFVAIEGLRLTDGAPIGQYVTVNSSLDQFGGPALASLGLYNTPLSYTTVTAPELLFDETSQTQLTGYGYSIIGVNESKTMMITGQVVSTYKFNDKGQADPSFKYLEYIRTGYLALEIFFRTLKSAYSQFRLTEGDLVPGRAMTNKEQIGAEFTNIYNTLASQDYALIPAGTASQKYFFSNLNLVLDIADGIVTASGILPIVTQIREIDIAFRMSFSIGG
jgi:phage tail sheath gpL-like